MSKSSSVQMTDAVRDAVRKKVRILAKKLGFEDDYHVFLMTQTGCVHTRDLTDDQLSRLADTLATMQRGGAVEIIPSDVPAAAEAKLGGQQLPTIRQWGMLGSLAREFGWEGINDPRFVGWCRHTAHVAELGEVSRREASKLITGLKRRIQQERDKAARAAAGAKS